MDPLLRLVRLRDANDYAEVTKALEPLLALARGRGCHLLCVHHMGKGDRQGGDAILGSTALFGAVDTGLLLRRREDGTRIVSSQQRYGTDLEETVVTLHPETGVVEAAGAWAELQAVTVGEKIIEAVRNATMTEPEIKDLLGGNQTLVAKALRSLHAGGRVLRDGTGRLGDPYRYGLP